MTYGYLFDPDGFQQSAKLAKLLKKLDIKKTTFHGLRDTHASFLFSNNKISIDSISQRLGHSSIQTTQGYYLQLLPEKKHLQDADALDLLILYRIVKHFRQLPTNKFQKR